MKKTVDTFFEQLELGDCRQHDSATIFPLFSRIEQVAEYLTLSEAYGLKAISVRETSESGSVPELLVINRADQPVLILDGEEILGAKQNRTLNTTGGNGWEAVMAVVGAVIGTCFFSVGRFGGAPQSSSNGQRKTRASRSKGRWLPSRKSTSSTGRTIWRGICSASCGGGCRLN